MIIHRCTPLKKILVFTYGPLQDWKIITDIDYMAMNRCTNIWWGLRLSWFIQWRSYTAWFPLSSLKDSDDNHGFAYASGDCWSAPAPWRWANKHINKKQMGMGSLFIVTNSTSNDYFLLRVLGRPEVFFGVGGRCCLHQADLQPECTNDNAKDGNGPDNLNTNFMIASRSDCSWNETHVSLLLNFGWFLFDRWLAFYTQMFFR